MQAGLEPNESGTGIRLPAADPASDSLQPSTQPANQLTTQPTTQPLIRQLSIDSRSPGLGSDTVFIALKGTSRDGLQFVRDAYQKGVRCFLAEASTPLPGPALWLIHPEPKAALQLLAAVHRERFSYPVLAITGSNGKTIVKEWLTALLNPDRFVVRNPRSFNSQIGVPLSVWTMRDDHEVGVFEAGISLPGEMPKLRQVIRPDMGLFTNIGAPHDEGFQNRDQKLAEKLELFKDCQTILFCEDQESVAQAIRARFSDRELISWSAQNRTADLQATAENERLLIRWRGESFALTLPFDDPFSKENLLHAVTAALFLGVKSDSLSGRIAQLTLPDLRLQVQQGQRGLVLVNDAYSSDLGSLQLALAFAARQGRPDSPRTALLSDMEQSGLPLSERYAPVSESLQANGFSRLIAVGPEIGKARFFDELQIDRFPDTRALLDALPSLDLRDQVLLIKGARRFELEQVAAALAEKVHGTRLEIDLDALAHNFSVYRNHTPKGTRIIAMVKALGYGSGDAEVASVLEYSRADYLGVAYADEGVRLRTAGIRLPILVLNSDPDSLATMLRYKLEPEVHQLHQVEWIRAHYPDLVIHLKLDTGMHRLGLDMVDVQKLLQHPELLKGLKLRSIFSHLAAAEDPAHDAYTRGQIDRFQREALALQEVWTDQNPGEPPPWLHILNSAGMLRFPDARNDMVRLGIGLYGHDPSGLVQDQLRTVGCLMTTVAQIREVDAGESIGYGRATILNQRTRVATLTIGYADGFRRSLSKGIGAFSAYGKRMPVLGNVCMDMTMADATGIPELNEGDSVEVFGKDISLEEFSRLLQTIPYEVLTGVSSRVKRVYLKG